MVLYPDFAGYAYATGVLTSADTGAFSNNSVVVVGGVTYTFKTTLTVAGVANEVKIGADGDACLTNLLKAVNLSGTAGTHYGIGTVVNPMVTAGAVTAHAITFTSLLATFISNTYPTTTTEAKLSWGATTLTGGVGGVLGGTLGASGIVENAAIDFKGILYSKPIDVGHYVEMVAFMDVANHAGTPTLDILVQHSPDGKKWVDGDAFTQVTTTDSTTLKRITANFGKYARVKLNVGGTTPRYTGTLSLVAKS